MNTLLSQGDTEAVAKTAGFQWAFWVSVVFTLVGLVATVVMIRRVELAPEGEPALAAADTG
jgi:hypothetical protein